MDIQARIRQFETMVAPGADPDNDMAWFSLGGAYAQAGRHADAASAYERCVALNQAMSKGYQLAGKAWIDAGDRERAKAVLLRGYTVAASRGDFMPKKAIGELLATLGLEPPKVEGVPEGVSADAKGFAQPGSFTCRRTGRPGTQLSRPPLRGPVGRWIFENISAETWSEWIKQGTKVINELRLDLSRDDHSATYDQHMYEYLGLDEETLKALA